MVHNKLTSEVNQGRIINYKIIFFISALYFLWIFSVATKKIVLKTLDNYFLNILFQDVPQEERRALSSNSNHIHSIFQVWKFSLTLNAQLVTVDAQSDKCVSLAWLFTMGRFSTISPHSLSFPQSIPPPTSHPHPLPHPPL